MVQVMRCLCESLEQRELLSAVRLTHGAVLIVAGNSFRPNTIVIGLTPDQQSVTATITYPTRKGPMVISGTFAVSKIHALDARGGLFQDTITIDQTNGSFPIPARFTGKTGNDTIIGGDEPDLIIGGGGNDSLVGGAGNDVLFGDSGNDTLIGGLGNDNLRGGIGHDLMVGGEGNDTLADVRGPDTLFGGDGNNVLAVRFIHTDPVNDYNPAKDILKKLPPNISPTSVWDQITNNVFSGF